MRLAPTAIDGVWLVETPVHPDERGWFRELGRTPELVAAGLAAPVQTGTSSSRPWTLRGLHRQAGQAKLVHVVAGAIFDVAVDLRRDRPTFGQHVAVHLAADEGRSIYLAPGIAHGLLALAPGATIVYQLGTVWDPALEQALAWNDPDLAIPWPLDGHLPILSARDRAAPTLRSLEPG